MLKRKTKIRYRRLLGDMLFKRRFKKLNYQRYPRLLNKKALKFI